MAGSGGGGGDGCMVLSCLPCEEGVDELFV